jgi:predicted Zn-dependent protease
MEGIPMKRWFTGLLLIGYSAVAWAQSAPKAPELPENTIKLEHDQLRQAINLLSKSEFEEAEKLIKPIVIPETIRVYGSWATIPVDLREGFRQAAMEAVQNWNTALGNALRIEWTDDERAADVQVVFEEDVAEITAGQFRLMHGRARLFLPPNQGDRRRVRARIATYIPYTEVPQSAKAVAHLVGQAIGTFLGLEESQKDTDLMGPVWSSEDLPTAPTREEVERVRALIQVRMLLADYAARRVALYLPKPRIVIEPMEYDFGETVQGEAVKHTFVVKNLGDAPLEIVAKPSCGCVTPYYDKLIEPGKEGKIEAELRTMGFRGAQIKTIQVTTNDPDNPNLTLRLTTVIRTAIEVKPSEQMALALKSDEPTVQEVEIVSNTNESLEVQEVSVNAPFIRAETQKIDDKRTKITFTISPEAPPGRSTFVATARTNSSSMPQVSIVMNCEKGIILTPNTVFFGAINSATPLPVERIVTVSRSDKGFQIKKFEVDDPNIEVRHEATEDNRQHRFVLRYKGGWQPGTVRRNLVIETDDTQQKTLQVLLVANVLASDAN